MIRAIFILEKLTKEKVDAVVSLGANAIFTGYHNLNKTNLLYLKKHKLKIFAEFGMFQGENLWKKYPDSRPVDRSGNYFEKIDWYAGVCPNNPDVRKDTRASIKRLIETYAIDGLWLDFIRYPCHWEDIRNSKITEYCFCRICLDKFDKEVGGKPEGYKWVDWKCKQIIDFVAEIKRIVKNRNKKILLGMFAVPWQKKEYGGAIKKIIGQDFKELAKCIDIFSPMLYQKFCGHPVYWIRETVRYFSKISKDQVLPIIQTEDKKGKIYPNEFRAEILNSVMKPSRGTIIFFLEDLLKEKNKVKIVREMFGLID